jgi:oligoribonuclease NrnB/cAMP/cGMP phosphodiesterase (DHH superfamily)
MTLLMKIMCVIYGGNAVKCRIDYESETVLPDEIAIAIGEAQRDIIESEYERDKIIVHLAKLKYTCIKWFDSHGTISEETQ